MARNIVSEMHEAGVIAPPPWLPSNVMYLTVMGSVAYGVSTDMSDMDVYGFCIPPKTDVFPHLRGDILGFGQQIHRFQQWQQHHIEFKEQKYDFSVYGIVDYFQLCMKNNPNMIDSLFTPQNCAIRNTPISQLVRENRKLFLHKGAWHKFKGYAYAQVSKMGGQGRTGKRKEIVEEFGYDVKFAYHVVRLLNEIEQILIEGDLDLQRNNEQLKSIRRGEWSEQQIRDYFSKKEAELESLYLHSTLPYGPDEEAIKRLLINCLEMHYGSLGAVIEKPGSVDQLIRDIESTIAKYK